MGTPITIHGGQGSGVNFAFTVTGTNTTAYALKFENAVNTLLMATPATLVAPDDETQRGTRVAGATPVYVLTPPTVSGGAIPSYTIATPGYVLDSVSSANITLDSAGGDTVLVAAINSEAAIIGAGTDNQITFVTGQNVYDGTADGDGDTLVAGSGRDTIYTSTTGSTTVYSGTGEGTFVLQDTVASDLSNGLVFTDNVYLNDGNNTIFASGMRDDVVATTEGQTIFGVTDSLGSVMAGSVLGVVLAPNHDGNPMGGNLVAGALTDSVYAFDQSSGNTIEGGVGNLFFIGGSNVSASVESGTGTAYLYGDAGDSVTLTSGIGDTGPVVFVAGMGNESLNGAASGAQMFLFGGTDTGGSDTLIGGSYANFLTAGMGTESLQGGSGLNFFQISDTQSSGANITLSDFSQNGALSTLVLDGFSQSDVQSIYDDTVTSGGNLVVTIGSSTSVTFTGISSGSQLQGHIVTFSS